MVSCHASAEDPWLMEAPEHRAPTRARLPSRLRPHGDTERLDAPTMAVPAHAAAPYGWPDG